MNPTQKQFSLNRGAPRKQIPISNTFGFGIMCKRIFSPVAALMLAAFSISAGTLSNHVWSFVKISYDPKTLKAEGGSCATVFFVTSTIFVTAHHGLEVGSERFKPSKGFPNVRVFLGNAKGDIIDDFWIEKRIPEYDLVVGRIREGCATVEVCELQRSIAQKDEVYNLGFPTDQSNRLNYTLSMEGDKLIVQRLQIQPAVQEGIVKATTNYSISAIDVKLTDKKVAFLSYTSRVGFSGGPLISKQSGKVVGMMSLVAPESDDSSKPAVAIRIADILEFLPGM